VIESLAFVTFLYTQIGSRRTRRVVFFIGVFFTIFNLLFPYLGRDYKNIDSIQIGIETIIVLIFSFYFLYEKMNDPSTLFIYNTFPFWIVLGMVIYLSGSFFIYIFADSISKQEVHKYWFVTNILSVLKNIFFSIGLMVNSKPPKDKMIIADFELSSLN